MTFSEQLEARYAEMLTHYPTRRSLLVPFLLFVQDELGYLTDEAITEVSERLELTELDVRDVISYYSMLRTHPVGRHHVQVCTNICCQLKGGAQLLRHVREKLDIPVDKGVSADGLFSVEEVECIGACSWAPAMMINYDHHEELTVDRVDEILDGIRRKHSEQ